MITTPIQGKAERPVSKWYWFLSVFMLIWVSFMIYISYSPIQNEWIISILQFVVELINLPVVIGVVFCAIFFGLKLAKSKYKVQYGVLLAINILTAVIMAYFTIKRM